MNTEQINDDHAGTCVVGVGYQTLSARAALGRRMNVVDPANTIMYAECRRRLQGNFCSGENPHMRQLRRRAATSSEVRV